MKFQTAAILVFSAQAAPYADDCEETVVAPIAQGYATQVAPVVKGYATQVAPIVKGYGTKVLPIAQGYATQVAAASPYKPVTKTALYKPIPTSYAKKLPISPSKAKYAPIPTTTCEEVAPATYAPKTTAYHPVATAVAPIGGAYGYASQVAPIAPAAYGPAPVESALPIPSPMVEVAPIAPSPEYSAPVPTGDFPASPSSPYNEGGLYATDADYEQVLPSSATAVSGLLAMLAVFVL